MTLTSNLLVLRVTGHNRVIGQVSVEGQTLLNLNKEEDKERLWEFRDKHLVAELNDFRTKEELVQFVVDMFSSSSRKVYIWHLGTARKYVPPLPITPRRGAVKTVGSDEKGWLETIVNWDTIMNK